MGLFDKPKIQSIALIDIGSASVGGAYAHFEPGSLPTIYYTSRVPIELRDGEDASIAMLRSLDQLGHILINHGAPILREATGNAHIDGVVASVSAPWQETSVRVESKQEEKPFLFTKQLLDEMTRLNAKDQKGRTESGESVIATILNGYEIDNPFGKRAKRADLVILSSTLEEKVSKAIEKSLRGMYHTHAVTLTAFAPLSYAVLRDMFPHEKDFLILEVNGEATDLAFVKRGLLADVASVPQGTNALLKAVSMGHATLTGNGNVIDTGRNTQFAEIVKKTEQEWLAGLSNALKGFATKHALPRTLFLLADTNTRGYLERLLDCDSLHTLWLSDEPLSIIPLSSKHLSQYVRTKGTAEGDLFLAMMVLFYNKGVLKV